jgi:hypothetical protein
MARTRKQTLRPAVRIDGTTAFGSTPLSYLPAFEKFLFHWNIVAACGSPLSDCENVCATLRTLGGEAVPGFENKALTLVAPGRYAAEIGGRRHLFDRGNYRVEVRATRKGKEFRWEQPIRVFAAALKATVKRSRLRNARNKTVRDLRIAAG